MNLMSLAIIAIFTAGVQALACFDESSPAIDYIFRRASQSSTFSSVKEYWFNKDTSCDLLIDENNKLTWYSTDISIKYQYYFKKGATGCRAETEKFEEYVQGT